MAPPSSALATCCKRFRFRCCPCCCHCLKWPSILLVAGRQAEAAAAFCRDFSSDDVNADCNCNCCGCSCGNGVDCSGSSSGSGNWPKSDLYAPATTSRSCNKKQPQPASSSPPPSLGFSYSPCLLLPFFAPSHAAAAHPLLHANNVCATRNETIFW